MKTNNHHDDKALRQVIAEQEKQSTKIHLPEDFADSVMRRIQVEQSSVGKRSLSAVRLRKVAAVIALAVCLTGLAYAAWEYRTEHSSKSRATEAVELPDSIVTFKNVRLDEIVSRVGKKYAHHVVFNNEALREWRFQISWDSTKSLTEFVQLLNEFDGLNVTEQGDTIIVNVQTMEKK